MIFAAMMVITTGIPAMAIGQAVRPIFDVGLTVGAGISQPERFSDLDLDTWRLGPHFLIGIQYAQVRASLRFLLGDPDKSDGRSGAHSSFALLISPAPSAPLNVYFGATYGWYSQTITHTLAFPGPLSYWEDDELAGVLLGLRWDRGSVRPFAEVQLLDAIDRTENRTVWYLCVGLDYEVLVR